VVGCCVG